MRKLLGKLKKDTDKKQAAKNEKQKEVALETLPESQEKKEVKTATATIKSRGANTLLIKRPWITERATQIAKYNQYIFIVDKRCNKPEAKKAIESIYGVTVLKVNSANVVGKQRRLGAHKGTTSGYKKVIVTLKEGQSIDVLPH